MKTPRRTSAGSNSPGGRSASNSSMTSLGGGPTVGCKPLERAFPHFLQSRSPVLKVRPHLHATLGRVAPHCRQNSSSPEKTLRQTQTSTPIGCTKLSWRSNTLHDGDATAAQTKSRKFSFVNKPSSFCARLRNLRSGWLQMTSAHLRAPSSRLRFPRKSTDSTGKGPAGWASSASMSSAAIASPPMASAIAMLPRSWMKLSHNSKLVSRGRLPRLTAIVVAPSSPMLFSATAM
mmetsp:Transcript_125162/g.245407  ORF Transcript_125162/g.245407 Transcript_125162/m.245407 type:complete len:233 (-) Transcript_125162:468-1166(-)